MRKTGSGGGPGLAKPDWRGTRGPPPGNHVYLQVLS